MAVAVRMVQGWRAQSGVECGVESDDYTAISLVADDSLPCDIRSIIEY